METEVKGKRLRVWFRTKAEMEKWNRQWAIHHNGVKFGSTFVRSVNQNGYWLMESVQDGQFDGVKGVFTQDFNNQVGVFVGAGCKKVLVKVPAAYHKAGRTQ